MFGLLLATEQKWLVGVGVIGFFGVVLYMHFFAIRCPVCGGNLSDLLMSRKSAFAFGSEEVWWLDLVPIAVPILT